MERKYAATLTFALAALTACGGGGSSSPPPAAAPAPVAAPPARSAAPATVAAALYDAPQATRGEAVFKKSCNECHELTEFAGGQFKSKWNNKPVFDFFEQIRTTMPDSKPGSLPAQDYIDLTGYVMKLNGMPAGPNALTTDAAMLKAARFVIP